MLPKEEQRSGSGRIQGNPGRQKGMSGGRGLGLGGVCICLNCGEKQPHERGKPCYGMSCPKCGSLMTRA